MGHLCDFLVTPIRAMNIIGGIGWTDILQQLLMVHSFQGGILVFGKLGLMKVLATLLTFQCSYPQLTLLFHSKVRKAPLKTKPWEYLRNIRNISFDQMLSCFSNYLYVFKCSANTF